MTGPADWRELLVVLAGTSWDGIWMSEQHLAVQLSARLPVLWVDPAVPWPVSRPQGTSGLHRRRAVTRGLVPSSPSMARLTPLTSPGVTRPVLREVAARRTRSVVERVAGSLGATVRGIVIASPEVPTGVLRGVPRVYYGTDDYVAGAELLGVDRAWLERRHHRHLAEADAVVAVSPVLAATWRQQRPDVTVIPNGCEAERFSSVTKGKIPQDVRLRGPIAGVFGQVSDRLDLGILEAVADRGISLLLVGPCRGLSEPARFDALVSRPGVQWVGEKDRAEMPAYLGAVDVGLTPYRDDRFNRASFPLKTLEYLAAGLPVVATDLPATRWLDTDLVAVARTAAAFAAAVEAATRDRAETMVARRRAFAAEHSWQRRAEAIGALLGLHPPVGNEGLARTGREP